MMNRISEMKVMLSVPESSANPLMLGWVEKSHSSSRTTLCALNIRLVTIGTGKHCTYFLSSSICHLLVSICIYVSFARYGWSNRWFCVGGILSYTEDESIESMLASFNKSHHLFNIFDIFLHASRSASPVSVSICSCGPFPSSAGVSHGSLSTPAS